MADSTRQGALSLAVSAAELVAGRVPPDDVIDLLSGLLNEMDTARLAGNGERRLPVDGHFVVLLGRDGSTAPSANLADVLGEPADSTPRALLSLIHPEDRGAALRAYVETSTGRRTSRGVRLRAADEPHSLLETTFVGMLAATGARSVVVYGTAPTGDDALTRLAGAREHRVTRLDLADGGLVKIGRTPPPGGNLALGACWRIRDATKEAWPSPATRPVALAAMSREIRAPLTAIADSAGLLADINTGRRHLAEEQQRAVAVIGRQTERMVRLADDLELLSRLMTDDIAPHQEDVRVPVLIDDAAVRWTSLAAAENILLTCRTSHGAPLAGDPRFLRRVLDNLIHNALTFSGAGSTVTVSATPDGPQWTIAVADRGIGIPAAELALVTRVFERGSNAVAAGLSGAGLGLPICQKLVESQRGTLTVESAVDVGTTVRVRLPGRAGSSFGEQV